MRSCMMIAGVALALTFAASGAFALTPMWETELDFAHPELYTVKNSLGDQSYWYVVYTIHNASEENRQVQPVIRIITGSGKVYEDLYIPEVVNVIGNRKGGNALHAGSMVVDIKAGETRVGVAVFNRIQPDSRSLTLWAYGLSAKRIESRGEAEGMFSRALKVNYRISGDRYNFVPARLKRESSGFVSVFRGPDGNVVEETVVVVPIEDEVKAMRAVEAAEMAKQKTPTPTPAAKPAEDAEPAKAEEADEPAEKVKDEGEEAAPAKEEGAGEATEAPAKEEGAAEEAKEAPAKEEAAEAKEEAPAKDEGAVEKVKDEAPAEKAAPADADTTDAKKAEKPAKKDAGTEKKAEKEAPAAE